MVDGESKVRVLRREKPSLMPGRGGRQRPVPGQALTMRVRREPGYVLVTVAGEIDIATVAQLGISCPPWPLRKTPCWRT